MLSRSQQTEYPVVGLKPKECLVFWRKCLAIISGDIKLESVYLTEFGPKRNFKQK